MNKKQAVEAKIRELNPELMELSFGCEVRMTGGETLIFSKENEYLKRTIECESAIIGHPIHLEHVLRALKFAQKQRGMFTEDLHMLLSLYNLSLPFSQQSDEVYEFLYEALFSNNT